MKTVVVTQSNYIPWLGFFDMVRMADEVILLDCVQYTRRDWRNRNKIKTPQGAAWLAIPVKNKGRYLQAIDETEVAEFDWIDQHLNLIQENYRRATFYSDVTPWFESELRSLAQESRLSSINECLLRAVSKRLGFKTVFRQCTDVLDRLPLLKANATERLVTLCRATGASRYITGPAARNYMDLSLFSDAGIEVIWMNYKGYPDYPQLWGEFTAGLSIIDLLYNTGNSALDYFTRSPSTVIANEIA